MNMFPVFFASHGFPMVFPTFLAGLLKNPRANPDSALGRGAAFTAAATSGAAGAGAGAGGGEGDTDGGVGLKATRPGW